MLLKDICSSITETKHNKNNLIFLNTSDILEGKILHNNYTKTSDMPGQAKKLIKNGDILFSEIRPHNKRYALVNVNNPDDYIVSTKLMVIRCNNKVNNRYLYYYLTSPKIITHLQEVAESRSGTFPQITFDEVKTLKIDLPNLEKQKHIVDTISFALKCR